MSDPFLDYAAVLGPHDKKHPHVDQVPFDTVPHGTPGGYTNWGCRCGDCRETNRNAQRRWRERRRRDFREGRIQVEHGMTATYTNYGCRCVACTAAQAATARRWSERRKALRG